MAEIQLTEKHRKLLELLRQNKWSEEELAQKSGYTIEYIYDLLGKNPATGKIGQLFNVEYDKIRREVEERISTRTSYVREKLIKRLEEWIDHQGGGSTLDTKTKHQMLTNAINAVNKSMPYQVNIEQYNWKVGMSYEEAVSEFNRLKGLGRQFNIRGRVSELAARGAAEVPLLDGQADKDAKDASDTLLSPERQAALVPSEQGTGKGDIRRE